jgi:nucleotide-binding universal stress UspA family protein
MIPIKTLVCPTDFSEPSYAALKPAVELAEHFAAKIVFVHVVAPVPVIPGATAPPGFHLPAVMNEIQSSAEKALRDLISERVPPKVQSNYHVVQGRPAEEIVNLAARESADLIVISTHGESGWQRLISGSVTEKVIRLAACPVLTVHAPESD